MKFALGVGAVAVISAVAAALYPTAALLVLAGGAALAVVLKRVKLLPPVLLLAAFPLARPNIFGEQLSLMAALLLATAAFLCIVNDHGRIGLDNRRGTPLRSVYLWLGISYGWLLFQAVFLRSGNPVPLIAQGALIVVASVVAAAVVLADERRRMIVGRGFVIIVAVLCASYTVTAGIWLAAGIGAGQVTSISVGSLAGKAPVFFPFTTTAGTQTVFGIRLFRFTGIGREPGWMAMYAAFAYFLAPRVGLSRWWLKLILLVGLLGCVSTAGFGVFLLVWAYEAFVRPRQTGPSFTAYLRQLFGLGAVSGAAYLAVTAPVLGLAAKHDQNAVSLQDRAVATQRGWDALFTAPLGGGGGVTNSGINLVASIAGPGLPYVLLVAAALLLPRRTHRAVALTTAPVAVLLLTLITSQPPGDSTWVFVAVLVVYAVTQPPAEEQSDAEVSATEGKRITIGSSCQPLGL